MTPIAPECISPIRSLDELLGIVPHLLGFHPQESLVLVALQAGRLRLTARVDLAALTDPWEVGDFACRVLNRFPGSDGFLVAYTSDPARGWAVLAAGEREVGSALLGGVLVDGDRWWAAPGEVGGPYRPGATVSAVEATLHGMVARACRDEIDASLAGGEEEHRRFAEALPAAEAWARRVGPDECRQRTIEVLEELVAAPTPSWDQAAMLAVAVREPDVRRAVALVTDADNAAALVAIWTFVARGARGLLHAAPVALAGLAAWVDGDGALQNVCADRARAAWPGLELANLLDLVNELMISPQEWPLLRDGLAGDPAVEPDGSDLRADEGADGVGQSHGQAADDHVACHRAQR